MDSKKEIATSISIIKPPMDKETFKTYTDLLKLSVQFEDIYWTRCWTGSGTINCHTYVIGADEHNIYDIVSKTVNLMDIIDKNTINKGLSYQASCRDWEIKDDKLSYVCDKYTINYHVLLSLAFACMSYESAIFRVAQLCKSYE